MSLIDYPAKVCSIVFTQGCVFRCSYCHNPDLIPLVKETYGPSVQDAISFLEKRKSFVDAVCITGGEPTLHSGLIPFIEDLKSRGFSVKLDTNGIRPDVVRALIEKGIIDYIAMDIKHVWERYADVIRVSNEAMIKRCQETFSLIQESGIEHEFRTTLFPRVHTKDDILAMAGYLKEGEKYFLQTMRTAKTLEPGLMDVFAFTVDDVLLELRNLFPKLSIAAR